MMIPSIMNREPESEPTDKKQKGNRLLHIKSAVLKLIRSIKHKYAETIHKIVIIIPLTKNNIRLNSLIVGTLKA